MDSFLRCRSGLFSSSVRKTVLICSYTLMFIYIFIIYFDFSVKLYVNVGIISYALLFTLLLLIAIRKENNPNTILTRVYYYGYFLYFILKTIYIFAITSAVIHKHDYIMDWCRIFVVYVLEIFNFIYARSYIIEVNEIIKEAEKAKNIEQANPPFEE